MSTSWLVTLTASQHLVIEVRNGPMALDDPLGLNSAPTTPSGALLSPNLSRKTMTNYKRQLHCPRVQRTMIGRSGSEAYEPVESHRLVLNQRYKRFLALSLGQVTRMTRMERWLWCLPLSPLK